MFGYVVYCFLTLFFPRVFGDAETKAMYKIESILKSYVNTKSYNLVDLMNHTFHAGTYEYQNDKLQFSFGIKTDQDITDVLGAVTPMLNKINTYTKSNSDISGKDIDISIRIEHWGDWIVILEPCLNRVAIGLSNQISITRVLSYCKEYEIIDIGGYWEQKGYYK